MDKFSPIAEETPARPLSQHEGESAVASLNTGGSQAASTESNATIRGRYGRAPAPTPAISQVLTSSYPFPPMSIDMGTPLGTPALHKPFTALSPTVAPSPIKLAKGRLAQEFKAAGHLTPASMHAFVPPGNPEIRTMAQNAGPNLYDVMLGVQAEPGLSALWARIIRTLRDCYAAERATLAVPSDSADIENVPWAQLATFNIGEEDVLLRSPNELQSTRESLVQTPGEDSKAVYRDIEQNSASGKEKSTPMSGSPAKPLRPRIESRHSYAGYPSKHRTAILDLPGNVSSFSRRPSIMRTGSHFSLRHGCHVNEGSPFNVQLSAEVLQRHDAEVPRGPLSEETYISSRFSHGRILNAAQPLESEFHPLLTSAGVLKVLDRNRPVVLTREYIDRSQSLEQWVNSRKKRGLVESINWPTLDRSDSAHQLSSNDRATNPKLARPSKRPDSQTSNSSKSSSAGQASRFGGGRDSNPTPLYEDYEQISPSPWSQSPAPSPAVQADPDLNPFFTTATVDENAFLENPPEHDYSIHRDIQAIGIDRAYSIVHVPLIHPTISPLKRPKRLIDERVAGLRSVNSEKSLPASFGRFEQPSLASSSESNSRNPIAILSILAPTVPYPSPLTTSLGNLGPLLATALYNARQHSRLQDEVVALRRQQNSYGLQSRQVLPNSVGTAGTSSLDTREQPFSPSSTSSVTSEHSSRSMHSPHGSLDGGSVGTPGWMSQESANRTGQQLSSQIPDLEHSSSPGHSQEYFPLKSESSTQVYETRATKIPRSSSHGSQQLEQRRNVTQSQGTDVKTVRASLPGISTKAAQMEQAIGDVRAPRGTDYNFKDPTSTMFKLMIDNGATQQFICEAERGRIVWGNTKFQAYRSESAAEIYKHPWNNMHPDDRKEFRQKWPKALTLGDQVSQQARLKRFDGQYRWFQIRILPLKDKQGFTKHWHGQAMDINDQHIAETESQRQKMKLASEKKYRALADSNPYPIFAASVNQGIIFANRQWCSYSGQTEPEALGFGFLQHVHPDDLVKCRFPGFSSGATSFSTIETIPRKRRNVRQDSSTMTNKSRDTTDTDQTVKINDSSPSSPLSAVLAPSELLQDLVKEGIIKCSKDRQGNLTITTEMRLKSASGEFRWHLVQGSYIESINWDKEDVEWFIACADITDQKNSEAQLKKANDALEKEMSRKMGYLSSMSHEIRTPLNGILGNLQFLANSGLDEHQQDWTFGAQKAAQGMHTLINDILDVSKAEAKMLKLSLSWFSPRSIIEEVMETLMSKATEKGLELCYEMAYEVPSTVKGDSGRIKQVLLNLIGNAIKFTRHGEVYVKCDLLDHVPQNTPSGKLDVNDILVRFTVKDTGSGFTEEDKKLLFKPYSQIDNNDTRNVGGTGLGLILCRTMVELHGGQINASSIPGKGSTFTFFARFATRGSSSRGPEILTPSISESVLPSPALSNQGHLFRAGMTESPGAIHPRLLRTGTDSPAVMSSSSSEPSIGSNPFQRSLRSSASTMDSGPHGTTMKLTLPSQLSSNLSGSSDDSGATPRPSSDPTTRPRTGVAGSHSPSAAEAESFRPPMLSILIVCPQENTRRTTQEHIQRILPKSIPAQVTSEGNVEASQKMISGEDPVTFTHIVLQLSQALQVLAFMNQILASISHPHTCIVVVTDQAQKSAITAGAPDFDYKQLTADNRLRFLLKPAKPYKFAKIFDPDQENSQNDDDGSRAELREKQLAQRTSYALFKNVLGGKGIRVLAVEDNHLNMEVQSSLSNFVNCC